MANTIFVHVFEGTEVWLPVLAEPLGQETYTIVQYDYYDPDDSSLVPQNFESG